MLYEQLERAGLQPGADIELPPAHKLVDRQSDENFLQGRALAIAALSDMSRAEREALLAQADRGIGQDATTGTIQAFRRRFEKKIFQAKRLGSHSALGQAHTLKV